MFRSFLLIFVSCIFKIHELISLLFLFLFLLLCYRLVRRQFDSRRCHFIFNWPNRCNRTMYLRWSQHLMGINIRDLPEAKGRSMRKTDNHIVTCELSRKLGASTSHKPRNFHDFTVTLILLPNFFHLFFMYPYQYFLCLTLLLLSLKLFLLNFPSHVPLLSLYLPFFPCGILLPTASERLCMWWCTAEFEV
jgi:hypothetical protein